MTRWLVVDYGSVVWQQFHGRARREAGAAVGAAFDAVRTAAIQFGAGAVVLAFDRGPYYRAALFPEYKAARAARPPDEVALQTVLATLPERLRRAGVSNVLSLAGFEADDHAAAAVAAVPRADAVRVLSADRDLLQLLRPRVELVSPRTGAVTTATDFRDQYNLHPSEYAEVKAIAGCPTDGVPGVDGAAEKTAARYLAGSLGPLGTVYAKIRHFVTTPEYARNLALVRLPFAGTPPAALTVAAPDWD